MARPRQATVEKMAHAVFEMQQQQMQQHTLLHKELLKLGPSPASADMLVDENHEDTVDKLNGIAFLQRRMRQQSAVQAQRQNAVKGPG